MSGVEMFREVEAVFTIRPRIPMDVPDRIADEIDDVEVSLLRSPDARLCLWRAQEVVDDGNADEWGFSGDLVMVELVATVLSDEGAGALWVRRPICEWPAEGGWCPSQELLRDRDLLPTVLRVLSAPEGTDRWGWAMLTVHAASSGGRVPAWCDDCAADDDCPWEQVVKTAMLGIGLPRGH